MNEIPAHATNDEIIKRLVVDELYWDARIDASKVKVEVDEGEVTLTGHVPNHADFYAAEADARLINGVVAVRNQLEIERPEHVPDVELCHNANSLLSWTPDVDSSHIEVTAREGVVTLRGTVRLFWEKLRARLVVSRMPGVVQVIDDLGVTPSGDVNDQEIADELVQTLERRLPDSCEQIQVTVKDGVVTLRGLVANLNESQLAQEAAELTHGVVGVENHLALLPAFHA